MQDKLLNIIDEEKRKGKMIIITSHYPKLYVNTVDKIVTIKDRKVYVNENC